MPGPGHYLGAPSPWHKNQKDRLVQLLTLLLKIILFFPNQLSFLGLQI